MSRLPAFADLVSEPDPPIDVLALAIAAEFRAVDAGVAIATLDGLAEDLSHAAGATGGGPQELAITCGELLGVRMGSRAIVSDTTSQPLYERGTFHAACHETAAGRTRGPYHFHDGVEEWMYVVSGEPVLRDRSGERALAPAGHRFRLSDQLSDDWDGEPGAQAPDRARRRGPSSSPSPHFHFIHDSRLS